MNSGTAPDEENKSIEASPGKTTILLVDDDASFQLGLKTFLLDFAGYEKVVTATSGSKALKAFKKDPSIEVVAVSHTLPDTGGISLLLELKEASNRPLSAILVADAPSDELETAFYALQSPDLLASGFVAKPVDFDDLEPVFLNAHHDLIKHTPETETIEETAVTNAEENEPSEVVKPDRRLAALEKKLDLQKEKMDLLKDEVVKVRKQWRADFWTVMFLLLVAFLAVQFGILNLIKPEWENVKKTISEWVVPPAENNAVVPPVSATLPGEDAVLEQEPAPSSESSAEEEAIEPAPSSEDPAEEEAIEPAPSSEDPAEEEAIEPTPSSEDPAEEEAIEPAPSSEAPAEEEAIEPAPSSEAPAEEEVIEPAPSSEAPAEEEADTGTLNLENEGLPL